MAKFSYLLVVWIMFLGASSELFAQYNIQLQKPNIIGLKTADLWNCTVQNNSNGAIEVFLQGSIVEKRKGKVYEVKSGNFQLKPGITIYNTVNYADLQGESELSSDKIFIDHIVRTNTLPNGEYTFCAFIYSTKGNIKLAEDCIRFSINEVTPPVLISPLNKGIICEEYPTFIWERQRGFLEGSNQTYNLKIVEVLAGQNPVAAMKSNPCYYCESNIKEPLHQFSFKGIPFQHERKYAWSISVVDNKREIARSDFWEFTWKKCGLTDTDSDGEDEEEDAEEEEVIVNNDRKKSVGYYAFTQSKSNYLITIDKKELNFSILNHGKKEEMQVFVFLQEDKIVSSKTVVANRGNNFYTLDLSQLTTGLKYQVRMVSDAKKLFQTSLIIEPSK